MQSAVSSPNGPKRTTHCTFKLSCCAEITSLRPCSFWKIQKPYSVKWTQSLMDGVCFQWKDAHCSEPAYSSDYCLGKYLSCLDLHIPSFNWDQENNSASCFVPSSLPPSVPFLSVTDPARLISNLNMSVWLQKQSRPPHSPQTPFPIHRDDVMLVLKEKLKWGFGAGCVRGHGSGP